MLSDSLAGPRLDRSEIGRTVRCEIVRVVGGLKEFRSCKIESLSFGNQRDSMKLKQGLSDSNLLLEAKNDKAFRHIFLLRSTFFDVQYTARHSAK